MAAPRKKPRHHIALPRRRRRAGEDTARQAASTAHARSRYAAAILVGPEFRPSTDGEPARRCWSSLGRAVSCPPISRAARRGPALFGKPVLFAPCRPSSDGVRVVGGDPGDFGGSRLGGSVGVIARSSFWWDPRRARGEPRVQLLTRAAEEVRVHLLAGGCARETRVGRGREI